jgi:GMP synthase (glutamine-hydrolysing)
MKLHIVMHESFEAPGAIEIWANKNNFSVSYTRLYQGDKLPDKCDIFDYLIVMGGPQSPATTITECPHFNAQAEIDLIAKTVKQNKYVLGICLGAQLIGEALGAKFDHSPNREIGVFEINQTADGLKDPIISKFPKNFPVGHWHGDMPGLTPETKLLAFSKGCPRQIVRYTPRVYGFQCHFEFTPETIEDMIKNCSAELEKYKDLPYIENAVKLRSHDFKEINGKLFIFLDYIKGMFERNN